MRAGVTTPAVLANTVIRSEGQRMLIAVTGTLAAIGAEVGAKANMVFTWKTGSKVPSANARARMQEAFGIPARAWSVLPGGTLSEDPATAALQPGAAAPSTLEDCLALLSVIRRDRQQAGLMPGERVRLAGAEAQILALRAKLEQAAELAESRYVVQHPAWLRLRRAIVVALEPFPDAAKAVVTCIAAIETPLIPKDTTPCASASTR
jgi:hypothetical protein